MEKHKLAPEGDRVLPCAKRAKLYAGEVIPISKPTDMADVVQGVPGEPTDTDVLHDGPCSVEVNPLEVEEIHPISNDEVDPGWIGMHDTDVGEMLDNEVDGNHYMINWHYFSDGNLVLVVHDAVWDTNMLVSAQDYKRIPHMH